MSAIKDLLTSRARIGDHVSATVIRDNQLVGFSESPRDGRSASVDRENDGTLVHVFSGPTPTNETSTEETCRRLLQWWCRDGERWELVNAESKLPHTDAEAQAPDGAAVRIQVVRAMADNRYWHEARLRGRVDGQGEAGDFAEVIRGAVALKGMKIPTEARSGLVLVLNALDTPVLAFPDVVEAFGLVHGDWVRSLGFASIWIVGPASGTIIRLD